MNHEHHEFYPQIHRTTEAMGNDQTPTPVKGHVSTHTDGTYYISVEGADGQQVADLIVSAMSRMPNAKQPTNGFFEFCAGIVIYSLLAAGLVNLITWVVQPQAPPRPTQAQIQISLEERGSGR